MSTDYYAVCEKKKLIMPIFTMNFGNVWICSASWMFDFILAAEGEEIVLAVEQTEITERHHDDPEWKFMNAWQKHPDDNGK